MSNSIFTKRCFALTFVTLSGVAAAAFEGVLVVKGFLAAASCFDCAQHDKGELGRSRWHKPVSVTLSGVEGQAPRSSHVSSIVLVASTALSMTKVR